MLYDADATANCLGQYTEDPAGVAPWGPGERHLTTWVPRDEADTGNYGVDLYFFTNAEDALKADGPVNGEPAYDKNETVITGNVIVTGTAVTDHYSRRLILNCLQNATG